MPPVTAPAGVAARIGAKGVVTGAKIGLRASGGKDRDKNFPSEALVTGWYGAATTELPPAAWSAEADVGAERRNQVPLSRSIAMSRGQTPRPRHDGPLLTGGGLAQPKRRGGCRADSCGHAATGEPPGIDGSLRAEARGVASGAGDAHSLAVWMNRNAGIRIAPKPCSRPLSDNRHARAAALDGKRKGVKGILAAPAAAPPVSRKRGDGSPITTQLPHARPGAARCGPGARSIAWRSPDSGGRCRPRGTAFSGARGTFPLTGAPEAVSARGARERQRSSPGWAEHGPKAAPGREECGRRQT